MKKSRKLIAVSLGLAAAVTTAITSFAASDARRDTSGMTLVDHREYYDGDFFIVDDVYFGSSPQTDTPVDVDKQPETGVSDIPGERDYGFGTAEAFDVTEMTKIDHREYTQNGLYIVDDVYYSGASELTAGDADALAVGDDVWVEGKVAIERSIYETPNANLGRHLATMYMGAEFEWNGETARVKDGTDYFYTVKESAGIKQGIVVNNKVRSVVNDQGSNFLFGNKYAYIEYVVTIKNYPGHSDGMDFRLYASVNRYGEKKYAG